MKGTLMTKFEKFSAFFSLAATLIGVMVILRTSAGWELPAGLLPNYRSMSLLSAVSLSIFGIILFLLANKRVSEKMHYIISGLLFLVMLIGAGICSGMIVKIIPSLGRVSPYLGFVYLFYSLALLLKNVYGEKVIINSFASITGVFVAFFGFAIILGYLFNSPLFFSGWSLPFSFNGGVCALLLGLGLVSLCGDRTAILGPLSGNNVSAKIHRLIVPFTIFCVVIQSMLFLIINNIKNINFALFAGFEVVLFVLIALFSALGATKKIFSDAEKAEEEREKALGIMHKTEEKYLKILEASPLLITITRLKDKCVIEANETAIKKLGGNIIGCPLPYFEEHAEPERELKQTQKTGTAYRGECSYKNKNGKEIILTQTHQIIEIENEKCVLTISEDITEQRQMEQQLLQTRKMDALGTLTAGIAHDFNNMLSVIIGYSDSTLRFTPQEPKVNENIQQIKKAAVKAAALTSQLLAFSRKQPRELMVIALNNSLVELKSMLERIIGEDIEFELHLEPALKNILFDKNQIDRIVVNLVTNSKHAMPKGGKLAIKTENVTLNKETARNIPYSRAGEFICMSVADTGIGIGSEQMEHLFEPFYTTKSQNKGSGLGLCVVYGIVKQQEGWINVTSAPGKGAEFKVFLPVYKGNKEVETMKEEFSGELEYSEGKRILVVEDDEAVLDMVSGFLKEKKHEVFRAANGKEALKIFEAEKGRIDLLFSDSVMPEISGLELARKLKAMNPKIKVIISSGYLDDKNNIDEVKREGCLFLPKPYVVKELFSIIALVFKEK